MAEICHHKSFIVQSVFSASLSINSVVSQATTFWQTRYFPIYGCSSKTNSSNLSFSFLL